MLKYFVLLCALVVPGLMAANVLSAVPMLDGRIVGGSDANIEQYPHQISMRYRGRHRCGGSVYSSNIIVSAAHCVVGELDLSLLTIVAGSTYLDDVTWELPVSKIIVHEKYTSSNDYDVAILVLRGNFPFNNRIQPISLAKARPEAGAEVIVTGWGTLVEGGDIPNQLQQVTVNYVELSSCKKSYPLMLTDRMLCAGVTGGGKDACQGDSGGPLIRNNELLGIVSWGIGCARRLFPGVYASVPDLYEWIENTARVNTVEYAFL
ncbi:trypsin delta-like [Musca domestica]|uniref:Trypsin delta-like n=1 Tax=Musca domestica TaxID=7370 RepID=A0A1I8MYT2_MUSDO|nr:trypsin delta-like [Musca domestica]